MGRRLVTYSRSAVQNLEYLAVPIPFEYFTSEPAVVRQRSVSNGHPYNGNVVNSDVKLPIGVDCCIMKLRETSNPYTHVHLNIVVSKVLNPSYIYAGTFGSQYLVVTSYILRGYLLSKMNSDRGITFGQSLGHHKDQACFPD